MICLNMVANKKILLVEDDKVLRNMYSLWLTSAGYKVVTAKEGPEGLEKILEGGWAMIILDVMLPKKDGLTILKELRDREIKLPNGPILVISNLAREQIINQATACGAMDCILKTNLTKRQLLDIITKNAILDDNPLVVH